MTQGQIGSMDRCAMRDLVPGVRFDESRIDALLGELNRCDRPGAAVGIAIGGRPVYRKAFGLANMEQPIVLSPTTRMRVISITKQFTCLALMLLCEEGRASPDDRVGQHLPDLHPVAGGVTLRQLMGNTGGLRDVHDLSWQFSGVEQAVSSRELLALHGDISDVNAEPGTAWLYSNGGFLLLTATIERITGQPLEDVLRARIFDPLGMHDTLLRRWEAGFVPNSATSHAMNVMGQYEKSEFFRTEWAGEGGMVSTVNDMLRWLAHMGAPSLGSAATWKMMKTPQTLTNGVSTGYGLGLFVGSYRGVDTVYHPGGGPGSNAWMIHVPAVGLDVIVLVNRQDVASGELAYAIVDACLPDLVGAAVGASRAGVDSVESARGHAPITGVFCSPASGRVVQLYATPSGQKALIDGREIPVVPKGKGVLRPAGVFSHMRVELTLRGDPCAPSSIVLNDYGTCEDLLPVPPARANEIALFVGDYRSESTRVEATIHVAPDAVPGSGPGDGVRLRTTGRFGSACFELQCLAHGVWRALPPISVPHGGGVLSFDEDGRAFRFSTLRNRPLSFMKVSH